MWYLTAHVHIYKNISFLERKFPKTPPYPKKNLIYFRRTRVLPPLSKYFSAITKYECLVGHFAHHPNQTMSAYDSDVNLFCFFSSWHSSFDLFCNKTFYLPTKLIAEISWKFINISYCISDEIEWKCELSCIIFLYLK